MTDVELAVADAADWLDRTEPGWADRVNVDLLRMQSSTHCILGQVFYDRVDSNHHYTGFSYGYYVAGGQYVHQRHPRAFLFSSDSTRETWVNAIAVRTVQAVVTEPQVREEEGELVAV